MSSFERIFRKIAKVFLILVIAAGVFSLCVFIPQVRELIIHFGEKYIGRPLTHAVWHERFIKWEIKFLVIDFLAAVVFAYFSFLPYLRFNSSASGIFFIRKELKEIAFSKTHGIELLALLAVLIGVRLFYITQKKSMHVDEGLSISICNRNEYGFWGKNYELGTEYSGKELKEISLWDNPTVKDSLLDVYYMHQYNRDTPHTNFYYSLLRLWFTGVKTSDLHAIFLRAGILNIFCFLISFFFMALLIRRFTKNCLLIFLCLLAAFINPASLSLTIFIRPYELQQTFIIILTYYVASIFSAFSEEANDEKICTRKNFFIGIFTLALTMLSAYFNMLIIALWGILIIAVSIRKKDFNLFIFFVSMFIFALLLAKILYFDFGDISYRGEEAKSNLGTSNILPNFKAMIFGIFAMLKKNLFFAVYCVTAVAATIYGFIFNLKKRNFASSAVLAVSFLSFFVILYFAPIDMKNFRYVAPLFPLYALCFICVSDRKVINEIVGAFSSALLILALIPFGGKKSVVDHIDDSVIANYKEIQETKLPVFIHGESTWKFSSLIPYLSDENKIIFISDVSEIRENYKDKIPCIFIKQDDESGERFRYEDFGLQKMQSVSYHEVFYVEE